MKFIFALFLWTALSYSPDSIVIALQSCDDQAKGALRLTGGENKFSGQVEICHEPPGGEKMKQWFPVCSNGWDATIAAVVCAHLGFSEREASIDDTSAQLMLNTSLNENVLECSKLENSLLLNCSLAVECSQLVTVTCKPARCRDGELRLRDVSTQFIGRVEICFSQQWGTVLDRTWSQEEANVACGQLGYSNSGALNRFGFQTPDGTGPIYIGLIQCNGNESRLTDCLWDAAIQNQHNLDAGVVCYPSHCNDGDMRLVNGTTMIGGNPLSGRVEVCINQTWGSVCDDHWNRINANLICSQLGFSGEGAVAVHQSTFGEPLIDPILLDNVQCRGHETNILECPNNANEHDCTHLETAGVICQSIPPFTNCIENIIRVVNGSRETEGRVEVCINRHWSSICDDQWTENDAMVACRQLGYSNPGAIARPLAGFGGGSGAIYLSGLECTGSETELVQCGVGSLKSCDHSLDVGVTCFVEQDFPTSTIPASVTGEKSVSSVVPWTLMGICAAALLVLVIFNIACVTVTVCMRKRVAHIKQDSRSHSRLEVGEKQTDSVHYHDAAQRTNLELEMDYNPSYGQCTIDSGNSAEMVVYESI